MKLVHESKAHAVCLYFFRLLLRIITIDQVKKNNKNNNEIHVSLQ